MTPDQAGQYRPHVGSTFAVGAQALLLEGVAPFEDAVTEGFALHFTGPREVLLHQGIYTLEHSALGALELFLVPVQDARRDCYVYEAVFNRLKPRPASQGGA